ncbi:MAG: sugar ABC transporter ATP-binding protein [Candidatus Cohnella colombiensis]|uniref:Sugar ABC transporter ATP-binding protein n=1 Tax=Candidatus Cohnella colombiensis TaxID=3121368 RepID=A0AA95F1I8_9BACL|nr:MAG: sugar ABC transporter ATP-binding protein [Cohnella sp.]
MTATCILEMDNIIKEFPGVKALSGVSFKVKKGEIHALVGENGAGKSTLMKVLSGVYPHGTYSGSIKVEGRVQSFQNTSDAEKAGISIIYQELSLASNLSIAENIFMGDEPTNHFLIDWDSMQYRANELLDRVGINIDSNVLVKHLGIGHQQMVEIAKALRTESKILVLDEPTSALSTSEVDVLMNLLVNLKEQGVTCIYISHKFDEIFRIADSVTILRDGQTIDTKSIDSLNETMLINLMVGRDLSQRYPKRQRSETKGEKVLELKNYSLFDYKESKERLHHINLSLHKGEILGIAGLMGAGRTELVSSLFGAYNGKSEGQIFIEGNEVKINSPKDAMKQGIGLITEDRKNLGIFPVLSIMENMVIANLDNIPGKVMVQESEENLLCDMFVDTLKIKIGSIEHKITSLSGGNQQKVIIGRWLMRKPKILILDEPTRGIDVGAKFEIYNIINRLVEHGVAVIVVSSELPEVMGICDRILVMRDGTITGEVMHEEATQEKIMSYAIGGSD